MKKSPGKLFFVLFLLFIPLQAQPLASYTLKANKDTVYEKEAFTVTFTAKQMDHRDNMMFLLKPQKSPDYQITLLNKVIHDKKYHYAQTTFTYLVFALKAKTLSIDFDFTIQTASDKAVAHSYVDDHDDSIAIQTYNAKMEIKPLKITVKKLAQPVDLVGDFQFKAKIEKKAINEYETVNIVYTLSGKGYEDKNIKPITSIKEVDIFSELHDIYFKLTQEGYVIKREYIYALSAKKSFTIPEIKLQAFSPRSKKYYTLKIPKQSIQVTKIDTAKLLDQIESPQTQSPFSAENIETYIRYFILFALGFITAKLSTFSFKHHPVSQERQKIKNAQSAKALLFVMLHTDKASHFKDEIKLLEEMVYNKTPHNFKKIKKALLKGLK